MLVPVYGGPASASNTARETFVTPSAIAEYGFLVVNLDSRAAPGMGKRTLDSIYLKLGQVEIDDMAEGVKALASRPYVDKTRVGIYGTSYGGYASVMSLLRYPDVYAAASASSPVTAWDHYDTIYTERYMWTPQENKAGYEAGSAMKYAGNLKGRLMLYYGTADNNVHPSNMMQLIDALQHAGKSFDVQVGPDRGHSGINTDRMMEFFIENLDRPAGGAADDVAVGRRGRRPACRSMTSRSGRRAAGASGSCRLLGVVLVVVNTWPLRAALDRIGRADSYDGQYGLWQAAWVARALVTDPLHVYDANIFYPHRSTLAFSEPSLLAGILGLPAYLATHSPYATHNLAVLGFFLLSFLWRLRARPLPHGRRCRRRSRWGLPTRSARTCSPVRRSCR